MADMPSFTPWNCNFFKRTISAADQSKLLSNGAASNENGGSQERLVDEKTSVLYDKRKQKGFITSVGDQKFLSKFGTGSTQELLNEMCQSSKELLMTGDKEKTER